MGKIVANECAGHRLPDLPRGLADTTEVSAAIDAKAAQVSQVDKAMSNCAPRAAARVLILGVTPVPERPR